MSHRDRHAPGADAAREPDELTGHPSGEPTPRRALPDFDDDPFDIPPWSQTQVSASAADAEARNDSERNDQRSAGATSPKPRSDRNPLPQLGDAFGRREPARRAPEVDLEDGDSTSVRDPYDRLRRVANRPPRPVTYDEDLDVDGADVDSVPVQEPVRRRGRGGGIEGAATHRSAVQTPTPARQRPSATSQLSGMLATSGIDHRIYLIAGAIGLLSLTFMAATVAGRADAVPDWFPIHVNAEGEPDRWGTPATLWRIPLLVVMLSLMSVGVAALLARRDRFAARFAVVSALLVHVCAWIALLNLV